MRLPGSLGALLEKDLRVIWRDPRLKAVVFSGLLGPLFLLLFVWRSGRVAPWALLALASFTGLSSFGANAFALERRGLILLVSFPVPRWKLLAAKNAGTLILRLPGLLLLLVATLLLVPPVLALPVAAIAFLTMLIAAGVDNFLSILFPVAVPAPGRNPYGPASGGRGLGAAAVAGLLMMGVLLAASPFVFLAWLPLLLEEEGLWLLTLPLALAGAAAVYAMLLAGAARLLERREPELLGRILGEE
jgi:ABC-2 type transport system permease protein